MPKAKNVQNQACENQIVDQVIDIIRFMGENKLAEIDLETAEMKLSLRKRSAVQIQTIQVAAPALNNSPVNASEARKAKTETANKETAAKKDDLLAVLSPMAGTFYRSPTPASDPFIKEGDMVKAGQTICIIEAMKMMNEIKSDKSGKVIEILFENGKPVDKGSAIIRIGA